MRVAQPSSLQLRHRLNAIMTRWHRLIRTACNPYRPELHYMRGPGPKWHAKHQGRSAQDGWRQRVARPVRRSSKSEGGMRAR
jgi:hypothetical protein